MSMRDRGNGHRPEITPFPNLFFGFRHHRFCLKEKLARYLQLSESDRRRRLHPPPFPLPRIPLRWISRDPGLSLKGSCMISAKSEAEAKAQ